MIRLNIKKRNWAGYIACICGLLYALPHYWWGLGISFGYPGDFTAAPDDIASQLFSYWFLGTAAVIASLYGLSFVYPWGDKLPRRLKLILAWIGCILLSVWGFAFFVMQFLYAIGRVVPAPAFTAMDAHPMAVWGYFWYFLFLCWGISLGFAAIIESRR
ncbi:DUF3995 domain-containing protein [Paenibacillus azoreducens]|uniref:DUF3995 domain-containing protein n=1 Tax=Paenibacillus azoreducens TaxID=116718 RepID=UPI0039F5341C